MPWPRPTLADLKKTTAGDLVTRLGLDALLRRSTLAALGQVVAGQAHLLHGHAAYLARQFLPDQADEVNLLRQASIWDISRTAATRSTGTTRFTGTDTTDVPAGSTVSRVDGREYTTDALATITAGIADVPITAVLAGVDGNADAATSLALVSPISGIDSASTVQAPGLEGGADVEELDDLRARLLVRLQTPPQGGANADYIAWALSRPAVTRAYVLPLNRGLGTVDVTFLVDDDPSGPIPDSAQVQDVQDYIDGPGQRPVTADFLAFAPTTKALDADVSIVPDTPAVRAAVVANLQDLLLELAAPGVTLTVAQIREAISTSAGESTHTLNSPAADVTTLPGEIVVEGATVFT